MAILLELGKLQLPLQNASYYMGMSSSARELGGKYAISLQKNRLPRRKTLVYCCPSC